MDILLTDCYSGLLLLHLFDLVCTCILTKFTIYFFQFKGDLSRTEVLPRKTIVVGYAGATKESYARKNFLDMVFDEWYTFHHKFDTLCFG